MTIIASYNGITIRFQNKTALTFTIETGVVTFPIYADWKNEEEKIIKQYKPMRDKVFLETEARLKSE